MYVGPDRDLDTAINPRVVHWSLKRKLYLYGCQLTQPPQEVSNRNLSISWSCGGYVSCD